LRASDPTGTIMSSARLGASAAVLYGLLVWTHAAPVQGIERDLPYGPDPSQRLDLSLPSNTGFPTVLFVHGGSLETGDKADEDYRNVCTCFPDAGIACANVNYRLAPAHAWPAQAEDVAAAVAWVRANIESRGGDPHALFLFGHSSGAMLVAVVGSDERFLAGQELETTSLRGVIPMGSIMWDDELEQALSKHSRAEVDEAFKRDPDNAKFGSLNVYLEHWPIRHVRAGLPPFLFLIAEGEQEQPPVLRTDRTFVEKARALGNEAAYQVLPGRTHYTAIRKLCDPGDPAFALVRDFVLEHRGTAKQ
jgi:arylformamidase